MPKKTISQKANKSKKQIHKQAEKRFNICKKTKCADLHKKYNAASEQYNKDIKKSCNNIKNDMKYYNCTNKIYNNDKFGIKTLQAELQNCSNTKCKKEKAASIKALDAYLGV